MLLSESVVLSSVPCKGAFLNVKMMYAFVLNFPANLLMGTSKATFPFLKKKSLVFIYTIRNVVSLRFKITRSPHLSEWDIILWRKSRIFKKKHKVNFMNDGHFSFCWTTDDFLIVIHPREALQLMSRQKPEDSVSFVWDLLGLELSIYTRPSTYHGEEGNCVANRGNKIWPKLSTWLLCWKEKAGLVRKWRWELPYRKENPR